MASSSATRIISQNLLTLRELSGLTQAEVARNAKLSLRSYQKLESAGSNPTIYTLGQIADTFEVPLSKLLSLDALEISEEANAFVSKLRSAFDHKRYGVAVRTLNGVLLWRNAKADEMIPLPLKKDSYPIDLLKALPEGPREMLKAQLNCERRGEMFPYAVFVNHKETGDKVTVRLYPTLILKQKRRTPHFSVVYIAALESDSQRNYFEFCNVLLKCALPPPFNSPVKK